MSGEGLEGGHQAITNLDANVSSAAALPPGPVVIVGTLAGSAQIAQIVEESGNKFLRLSTGPTKGYVNMFLPYVGQVAATGGQRVVVEYSRTLSNGSSVCECFPAEKPSRRLRHDSSL